MATPSGLRVMKVLRVAPSGDFEVDCVSTACQLAGFVPTNNRWTSQAVATLSQLVVNQPLKGAILGVVDNVTVVSLYSDRPVTVSISQQLVEGGHGQFTTVPLPLSNSHKAIAYVSHSDSPDDFWLQMADASLDDIAVQLEDVVLDVSLPLTALYKGVLCMTRFNEDKALYRAEILSASVTEAKVLFVDYGNTQMCEPVDLFPIPATLAAPPALAIHCSLAVAAQLKPVTWSEEACKKFLKLVQDVPLSAQFESLQKGVARGKLKWVVSLVDLEGGAEIANAVAGLKKKGSSHVGGSKDISGHALPPLNIPLNTPLDVCISYIESPAVFWLQLSEQYTPLAGLMDQLALHYSSASLLSSASAVAMQKGSLCVTKFSEDGNWYRAKVVRTEPDVVVEFIDYGNTEVKKAAELFPLPPQFTSLPCQSIPCSLANYNPHGRDAVTATRQLEMYLDQQLVGNFLSAPQEVVGLQRYSVQLFDTTSDKDHDIGKTLSQQDADAQNVEIKPATIPSSTTPAYVTAVVSPSQIYIQLVKWESELSTLLDSMYAYYTSSGAVPLTSVKVGTICAALFSMDGSWYRAKVTSVKQGTASVVYIDYGNSEDISCSELMPLCPQFSSLPAQAIQCALAVGEGGGAGGGVTWIPTAANIITSYTVEKEVLVTPTGTMEGRSSRVRIVIGGQDLGEMLMTEGVAKLQHSIGKDSPHSQIAVPFPVLRPGSVHKCIVLEWKSEQSFSCQFNDSISDLETLSNDISVLYSSTKAPPKIASARPGDFICGQFTEDDFWYRARVKSKCGMDSGSFEVLYLDYGNREMLHVSRMRELVEQVCHLPAQSIECFAATVPRGVSHSDEEVFVRILQQTGERSYSVEIVQPGEEEISFSFAADKIQERSFIDVQVTHIVSPNLFYCIEPQALAKLQDLLSQLKAVGPSLSPCTSLTVGQACVAMFSQDQCYYRGRVVKVDHSQATANVFFVDYGNSDVVPFSHIHALPGNFRDAFPCQAIPCSLDCTSEPPDGWTDSAIVAFEDLTIEEMFVAEIREKQRMESGEDIIIVELLDGDVLVRNRFEEALSMAAQPSDKTKPNAPLLLMPYRLLNIDRNKPFQALVTHVNNPSSFYVQPSSQEQTLIAVNENIDALLGGGKSEGPVQDLHEGAPCLAKYSVDQQWYRGLIEGRSSQKWKVRFVDFGNNEEIYSQSDLHRLSPELLATPMLAIHCGLQGIVPSLGSKGWSRHTVSAFKEILLDTEVTITVTKTSKDANHLVQLRMENGEDAVDCLVRSGFTSRSENGNENSSTHTSQAPSEDLYLSTTSSHIDSSSSAQPSSQHSSDAGDVAMVTKTPPTSFTYPTPPGVGTKMQVVVVYATSPVSFFCQDMQSSQMLTVVMDKLALSCPSASPVASASPGQPCAALYSADGGWYRAEVVEEIAGSRVLVQFVDFGNTEEVELSSIVALPSDVISLPAQALWCSLSDDFEKQYSQSEAADFVAMVTEECFELVVKGVEGESMIVSLQDSNGVTVTDTSCKMKGGGGGKSQAATASSSTLLPAETHRGSFALLPPLQAGAKINAVVTFVNSPADFFCLDTKHSDALDALMANLETHCSDSSPMCGVKWSVGDVCAAQYSVDGGWYRAEVTDMTDDGRVTVQYVDYGNIETVEPTALQPLTAEHLLLPAQAIWCSVTDDFELQFSDEHMGAFKAAVCDQECNITVKKCDGESVIVEVVDQSGQVFDESYFKGEAPPGHKRSLGAQKTPDASGSPLYFTYSQPQMAKRSQVMVTYVTSPCDFYCQDTTKAKELDRVMNSLAEHCSKASKPAQFTPGSGEACGAVFSADGEWYRAEVVESDDQAGKVLVQFVDYGNTELVDSGSIRPLQPELVALPPQAIWCSITTDFTKVYSQSEIASFSDSVQDQNFEMEACSSEADSVVVKLFDSAGQQVFPREVEEEEAVSNAPEPLSTAPETSAVVPSSAPSNEPVTYGKLPKFNAGDKMVVYITYVVSPADFHCQLCGNKEQLDILMAELADHCNSMPPEDSIPLTEGQVCAAASSMDGAWYRAEVTEVCGDYVVVFFVDYGNSEKVPLNKTRPLMPKHALLPAQAIWCSLTSDFSCEFEASECVDFSQEATENVYTMEVVQVEDDCLVVRLLDDNGDSLFHSFGKKRSSTQGSAAEGGSNDVEQETGVDRSTLQQGTSGDNLTGGGNLEGEAGSIKQLAEAGSNEREVSSTLSYKPVCLPRVGTRQPIQVTHVSSPTDFYCQVLDNVDAVVAVQDLLTTHEATFAGKLTKSSLNQPCAAVYSETDEWYRAEITEITSDTKAIVQFVDWGNSEEVPVTNLKPLTEEHLLLPVQALWCSVTSNFEREFGEDEIKDFVSVVKGQVFELEVRKIIERTAVVTLWDEEGTEVGRMFSDRLSRKSSGDEELERIAERLLPGDGDDSGKAQTTSSTTFKWPLKVGIGDKIDVYISSIDSADSFFCQPLHMAAELDDIMTKMADLLAEAQPMEKSRIEVGVICAGCFSQEDSWYRAVIEEVISSDQVLLRFIDYGNQEVVPVAKLAELPSQLLSGRAQLIHCSCVPAAEPLKSGRTEKMEEAFKEVIVEGSQYIVTVVKEISRGKYLVRLCNEAGVEVDMSTVLQLGRVEETIVGEDASSNLPSEADAEEDDGLTKVLTVDEELRDKREEEEEEGFESAGDEFQTTIASIPSPPIREKQSLFGKTESSDSDETSSSTDGPISPSVVPFKLSLGVKEVLQVQVVAVDNPSIVYIQRCDCMSELDTLMSDIDQYTSTISQEDSSMEGAFYGLEAPPKKGEFVLARFSSDTVWNRAEVLGEYDPVNNTCQLFSVDYGNSEDIALDSILFCPKSFLMLPQQAILCCLADVPRRDNWPIEYQNTVVKFVSGKVLQAEVVLPTAAGERAVIRLMDMETGRNLSQEIVCQLEDECGNSESSGSSPERKQEKEVMLQEQEEEPSLEKTEAVEHTATIQPNEFDTPPEQDVITSVEQEVVVPGSDQNVITSLEQDVDNPTEQEVGTLPEQKTDRPAQPTDEQGDDELPEIVEAEKDSGLTPLPKLDSEPQEVATPQEVDATLQQSDISPEMVVTTSSSEPTPPKQDVATPPEQEAATPLEQKDLTASEQEVGADSQQTDEKEVDVLAEEGAPLSEEAANLSLGDEIDDDEWFDEEEEEEEDRDPIGFDPSEYCISIPNSATLEVGVETAVILSHVDSPHSFFCHRASRQDNLDKFMEDLNNFYNDLCFFDFKLTDEPEEGEIVCFQSGEDETWYRGEVASIDYDDEDDPKVDVMFVDYGSSDVIPLKELCRLAKEFGEEAPFAIQCSMIGVESKSADDEFSEDCIEYLESYLETKLKIQVLGMSTDNVARVVLSTPDGRSLNQAIVNAGYVLATSDGQFTDPLAALTGEGEGRDPIGCDPSEYCDSIPSSVALEVGVETAVILSHVDSPHSFFCHRASRQDKLERFMEDLNNFYNDLCFFDFKFTGVPKEKDIVCFQSGEDETWYRGEVVSVDYSEGNNPKVDVMFVDYGSSDVIPLKELCRLAKEFGEEAPFAIHCSMIGVESKSADGVFSEDCIEYLESYLEMKLQIQVLGMSADNVARVVLSTPDGRSLNQAIVNAGYVLAISDGQFTNPLAPPTEATPSSESPARDTVPQTAISEGDKDEEEVALQVREPVEGEAKGDDPPLAEGDGQGVVPKQLQGAPPEDNREQPKEQLLPSVDATLEEEVPAISAREDPEDVPETGDLPHETGDAVGLQTGQDERLHQTDDLSVARQLSDASKDVQIEPTGTDSSPAEQTPPLDGAKGSEKDNMSMSPSWEVVSTHSSDVPASTGGSKDSKQAPSVVSPEASWEVISPNSFSSLSANVDSKRSPVVPTAKTTPHPKPLGRGFRDSSKVGVNKAQQPSGLSRSLQPSPHVSPLHKAIPSYSFSLGSSPKHLMQPAFPYQPASLHSLAFGHVVSPPHNHMGQVGGFPGFSPPPTTPPTGSSYSSDVGRSLSAYKTLVFTQGDRLELLFSSADSPEQFICHLIGSGQILQPLMHAIQEHVREEGGEGQVGEGAGPGTPVLVQCSSDGQWYRGEVLQDDTDSTLATNVLLVDRGTIEQVSTSTLRPLPAKFQTTPCQALHCSLAYIEPVEAAQGWTEEAVKDFVSIIRSSASFQAVVTSVKSDGQLCVQAEIGNGNEDVADKLVAMGHASPRLSKM